MAFDCQVAEFAFLAGRKVKTDVYSNNSNFRAFEDKSTRRSCMSRFVKALLKPVLFTPLMLLAAGLTPAWAGEADLIVPNLASVSFLGVDGKTLLLYGIIICLFGLVFGVVQFISIMKMPVHKSMKDISELIYETCKTYLITQGKFLLVLEVLVGLVMIAYFGWLRHMEFAKVAMILICSLIGIAGSYGVCLLYTSDAADDLLCVDLGGRRIIKKKKKKLA